MLSNLKNVLKATIINLIVALIFSGIIFMFGNIVVGNKLSTIISLVNKMSVDIPDLPDTELVIDTNDNKLVNYPAFGSEYAHIKIEAVGIDAPVYYGDNNKILKLGVGHYSGSYFPGEGGSIIYAAHNNSYFRKLPNVKVGDIVNITTNYGEFNYQVYDTLVIHQSEDDKLPIDDKEEILMLYTCYPLTGIGHKQNRFVVYAKLMEE